MGLSNRGGGITNGMSGIETSFIGLAGVAAGTDVDLAGLAGMYKQYRSSKSIQTNLYSCCLIELLFSLPGGLTKTFLAHPPVAAAVL